MSLVDLETFKKKLIDTLKKQKFEELKEENEKIETENEKNTIKEGNKSVFLVIEGIRIIEKTGEEINTLFESGEVVLPLRYEEKIEVVKELKKEKKKRKKIKETKVKKNTEIVKDIIDTSMQEENVEEEDEKKEKSEKKVEEEKIELIRLKDKFLTQEILKKEESEKGGEKKKRKKEAGLLQKVIKRKKEEEKRDLYSLVMENFNRIKNVTNERRAVILTAHVLKEFLEIKFRIPKELTYTELIDEIKQRKIEKGLKKNLMSFFENMQYLEYANMLKADVDSVLNFAMHVVENLKAVEFIEKVGE
jgi:hypothetical protein